VGLVCDKWGRGIEEGGGEEIELETFGGWRRLTWNVEERNRESSTYFVCDFDGR